MDSPAQEEVTELLDRAREGNREAVDRLLALLYDELHGLARRHLRHERRDHTLQPTALVHEAYLRLVRQDSLGFHDRAEFFGAAAKVMRRVLVDHARAKRRKKRGGDATPRRLDTVAAAFEDHAHDLLALDAALAELAAMDARKARLVELRFFAGLGMEDCAKMLGISLRTAERDWTMARAWLHGELTGGTTREG